MYPHLIESEDYDERLRLCIQAGTPAFIIWSTKERLATMKTRAEKTAKEWETGYAVLTAM